MLKGNLKVKRNYVLMIMGNFPLIINPKLLLLNKLPTTNTSVANNV